MNLVRVYERLLVSFGPQGWWPVSGKFAPAEWEVCIGAVLTQNTNWANVEKALAGMAECKMTNVSNVQYAEKGRLEQAIRSSGFYRQKAERLRTLAEFISDFGGFRSFAKTVTRNELLSVKGLGPETVDSILLYALNRPVFVIDAYTRRVFTRLGFNLVDRERKFGRQAPEKPREDYELWRWFFETAIPKHDSDEARARMFKEFHALIVELAKRHCRASRPACGNCPLNESCQKNF